MGIRGPIRMLSRPPREANTSITRVVGTNAAPAASAPYPLTVWSWMVTKKPCAPSAPYTSNVITFEALKVRSRKMPSTSIGSGSRSSTTTKPIAATTPTATAIQAAVPPHSMSAYVAPPSAAAARTAPVKSKWEEACGSRVSGT